MNLSQAIELMKVGKSVAREGWNDGSFIYLVPANEYPAVTEIAKSIAKENGKVPYLSYIAKATKLGIAMYSPTHEDLLSNDWVQVRFE